jgi:hypothetical protein
MPPLPLLYISTGGTGWLYCIITEHLLQEIGIRERLYIGGREKLDMVRDVPDQWSLRRLEALSDA